MDEFLDSFGDVLDTGLSGFERLQSAIAERDRIKALRRLEQRRIALAEEQARQGFDLQLAGLQAAAQPPGTSFGPDGRPVVVNAAEPIPRQLLIGGLVVLGAVLLIAR